jgi:hypothetical protein
MVPADECSERWGRSGRYRGRPACVAVVASVVLGGCSHADAGSDVDASSQQPVIIGADDRREVFEVPSAPRDVITGSTAALFYSHQVVVTSEPEAVLRARPATEAIGICDDESFASQPSAARCSGVLIDDDLVATASHCMGGDPEATCRQTRIVFGFWYAASDAPIALQTEDVYTCKRVVVTRGAPSDFAVLQLDRAVGPRRHPVSVSTAIVRPGDRVALASHGAGLPLKIELDAEVLEVDDQSSTFLAATDTFAGSSGGPLFDASLDWVGIAVSGSPDWTSDAGCSRPTSREVSEERHQHALPIVQALCDERWPSALCGSSPECGDAVCNGPESNESCATDCPSARCGDDFCELPERGVCAADCNRDDEIPVGWPLSPDAYWRAHPKAAPPRKPDGGCTVSGSPGTSNLLLPGVILLGLLRRLGNRNVRRARAVERCQEQCSLRTRAPCAVRPQSARRRWCVSPSSPVQPPLRRSSA